MDQVTQLTEQVASLERQLSLSPDVRAAARIAELETELTGRAAEQARLYAIADGWRAVHAELRAEAAAVQKRQIDAKRAAARDVGALETHKDRTRELKEELSTLRAQQAGTAATWPVVRSRPHARVAA